MTIPCVRESLGNKRARITQPGVPVLLTSLLLMSTVAGSVSCSKSVPQVATTEGPAGTASRPGTTILQPGTTFTADPNPILLTNAAKDGSVKLSWSSRAQKTTVHVDSPAGRVIANGDGSGTVTTGKVSNGTMFYLQDAHAGNPEDRTSTLATLTMQVIDQSDRTKPQDNNGQK